MKLCLVCNGEYGDEEVLCPKDGTHLVLVGSDPLIGTVIEGRYRLEAVCGKGAMGVVYRASQELVGRKVAVKVLNAQHINNKEALKRFHHEAKAASRLNHPHIVKVYDYGVLSTGQPFIVMDFLLGSTLDAILAEKKRLPLSEVVEIFSQVCEALAEAHSFGVIHRDVKPDNIFLVETNTNKHSVKMVDFGIAKLLESDDSWMSSFTDDKSFCGSPAYMSPERFENKSVDLRSDIYSLGVCLFEALTGKVPFVSSTGSELMNMHLNKMPPRLVDACPDKEFSKALESLVASSLSKDPRARPQSMTEFEGELVEIARQSCQVNASDARDTHISRISQGLSQEDLAKVFVDHIANKMAKAKEHEKWRQPGSQSREELARIADRPIVERWQPSFVVKVVAFAQMLFPYLVTFVLLACLCFLAGEQSLWLVPSSLPNLFFGQRSKDKEVHILESQGKYLLAISCLEEIARKGKLTKSEWENLNYLYICAAKREMALKHYQSALNLINKVAPGSRQQVKARVLKRRLKTIMGNSMLN